MLNVIEKEIIDNFLEGEPELKAFDYFPMETEFNDSPFKVKQMLDMLY